MAYDRFKQRLDAGEVVILDGATGTELQRRGAAMDPAAWCGPATMQNESLLSEIHADYIAAGAEVITANTFASSRLMLSRAGYGAQVEEINRRAVEAALRARDKAPGGADVVVAGSLSHMVPVAEGTALVDPGDSSRRRLRADYPRDDVPSGTHPPRPGCRAGDRPSGLVRPQRAARRRRPRCQFPSS
jgi:hypothetical protein